VDRHRPPYVAQGTWRDGTLHVWGWNGIDVANRAWLYGGFGIGTGTGSRNAWRTSPVTFGDLDTLRARLPSGALITAPSVRLRAHLSGFWLLDEHDDISPSLKWFARVGLLAHEVITSGHLRPCVEVPRIGPIARWRHVPHPAITATLEALAAAMPPVCMLDAMVAPAEVLDTYVDELARADLAAVRWRPDLGRSRQPPITAAKTVLGALAASSPTVPPAPAPATTEALGDLVGERWGPDSRVTHEIVRVARALEVQARRAAGEPAVRPRVRLALPADALDPWVVTLELVDDDDPGKWCTAADVWSATPLAVDLVGAPARLGALADLVHDTAQRLAAVPGLGPLADDAEPIGVELELDEAALFVEAAPFELERLDIELLGPEQLIRARVGVRGNATTAPADDRGNRFGRDAIVDWQPVVVADDDARIAAVTDADLARAEAAGATLMRVGHRWVRIDPAAVRAARRLLDDHRTRHGTVDPLTLLRLAAEIGPDGSGPEVETGVHVELLATPLDRAADDARAEADHVEWVTRLLNGLPDETLTEAEEPDGFVGALRPYQRRGLAWLQLLARLGLGGCLADDMGLGKTATTLAHLVDRPGPHLVVCPLSVVHNWEAEAARFTPGLEVVVHHGAGRELANTSDIGERTIVLTTYGLLPRDIEALAGVEWGTVVLDEAQTVKNPNTKAARAVRLLRAAQKIALTGTPVENRLSELWAILDAVNPGSLGGLQRFRDQFGVPIERHGDEEAAARLRRLTRPFVLRRTKADRRLIPDLPDKIEQIAWAELTREQVVLYQRIVDELLAAADEATGMKRRGLVLAALTRLKQICNHPAHALRDGSRLAGRSGKLARFDEIVHDLLDIGDRAIVFTQFREMGELLTAHITERFGVGATFLHGGVSRTRRTSMIAQFQNGTGPPILVVSLKAGGTGLNLTAATHVVHYDRWWNPAVEDQATDRAWRIGQDQTVHVHKLVCRGTVEERIGQIIDDKRALADAVVGSGEAWLSELSTDQLRELVVLDRGVDR
jgi:hypothetical protein